MAGNWNEASTLARDEILHHACMRGGPLESHRNPTNNFSRAWDEAQVYISDDGHSGRIIFDSIPYTFLLKDLPQ